MFFAFRRETLYLRVGSKTSGNRFRIVQLAGFTVRMVEGDPFRLVSGVTRWGHPRVQQICLIFPILNRGPVV